MYFWQMPTKKNRPLLSTQYRKRCVVMGADVGLTEVLSVISLSHKSAEATSSLQHLQPIKRPMLWGSCASWCRTDQPNWR
jgi:hypothetical protein